MKKEFLSYGIVRNNALKLARKIYLDGFIPDVIYVFLRGGAYLGNVISEYFKVIQKNDARSVYYAAVVARSYTGIKESGEIKIDGWTYSPKNLRPGDKVLLIDDIFDTGKTINHLSNIIINSGIPRENFKIAVHDYKCFFDSKTPLAFKPDYWCRKHDLSVNDEDMWIHYSSHELVGLSQKELEEYYYKDDPDLFDVLGIMHEDK